ncbi:MAG: class I SAM-dependent methyltransferase [Pirellulales bacterium]
MKLFPFLSSADDRGDVATSESLVSPAPESTLPKLPLNVAREVRQVNHSLRKHGWCTPLKAQESARSIYLAQPKLYVEVGVYGGRSLLPVAVALKHLGQGVAYGIEAWSGEVAVETPTSPEYDAHWGAYDFARVKQACLRHMIRYRVLNQVKLLECRSREGIALLAGRIDMIHIDGSHSEYQALEDVRLAFDALAPRGYLWMDDIAWGSVGFALNFLHEQCETIREYDEGSLGSYGLYRKRA